jgi:hypothetical protein
MRIAIGLLACLGTCALTSALADPPAEIAPTATGAPAATSAPAAPAAATSPPASKPAASEIDPDEKHFIAAGYKPEMRGGVKVFCRREQVLGSRLGGEQKHCATVEQLKVSEQESKDLGRRLQQVQKNPQGG